MNARISTSKLAREVGLAETAVRVRIKRLEKEGAIACYRVLIDYSQLGLLYFWVHCDLKEHKNIDKIEKAVCESPNTVYSDRAVGGNDLEFGMIYENPRQLEAYFDKVKSTFPSDIREIEYVTVLENIKVRYLPEAFEK
jgi:DNA-binding Lrp family transcriptional regulator